MESSRELHRTNDEGIAVSPILADPDKNNCAEQMHDCHLSGRIRPLDQSEVVQTVGRSCPDRPELGRLQYVPPHVRSQHSNLTYAVGNRRMAVPHQWQL